MLLFGVPRRRRAGADAALTPGRATQLAALLALRGDWIVREELVAHLLAGRRPQARPAQPQPALVRAAAQRLGRRRRSRRDPGALARRDRRRGVPPSGRRGRLVAAPPSSTRTSCSKGSSPPAPPASTRGSPASARTCARPGTRRCGATPSNLADAGQAAESARLLRRLLASDDLLEDAVQALMRLEARAGRRDAALQVYDAFRARLAGRARARAPRGHRPTGRERPARRPGRRPRRGVRAGRP